MKTVYFKFRNHYRRTVDGAPDKCPDCGRPREFASPQAEAKKHRCRRAREPYEHRVKKRKTGESGGFREEQFEDEEDCVGARIETGFYLLGFEETQQNDASYIPCTRF
jgi:hypothetical protein